VVEYPAAWRRNLGGGDFWEFTSSERSALSLNRSPGRTAFFATDSEQRKDRAAVGQTPVDGTAFFRFGPELSGFSFCNSDEELAGMWFGK
jgi:hypothetical protein